LSTLDRRAVVGGVIATAAAGRRAQAREGLSPAAVIHGFAFDSMTLTGPGVDPRAAYQAGLKGSVVDLDIYPREFAAAEAKLKAWQAVFAAAGSPYALVRSAADLAAAGRAGRYAVVLTCQDASILGAPSYSVMDYNLANLRHFHGLGLRSLQLTHNDRNGVGDGYRERRDAGVSLLGEAVVGEMNRLGMLVDVSHCSDLTTLQAIRLSKRPCAITHAGCRALMPSRRNKTDEAIRALAEAGGYFGVFNASLWLTTKPAVSVEDAADHIEHVAKIGGVDLVGFGSDHGIYGDTRPRTVQVADMESFYRRNAALPGSDPVNGHATIEALDSPGRLQIMARALERRGWRPAALEKFLGGNFARVFAAACG